MKNYTTPEVDVKVFDCAEVICASSSDSQSKITGGGGGVVLPDDEL